MISVVIPVYNVEKYLAECIESVLCQSYTDYEVILVDDGSTDGSGQICDEYARKEPKIRVMHQPNGGLSAARNAGFEAARGEYVYFLDSDDHIEPQTLESLFETAEREKADFVFFDGYVFFDGCEEDESVSRYERQKTYNTKNGRDMLSELLVKDEYRTAVPLMMFKREYLERYALNFLEGVIHEDEIFTFLVFNADGTAAHCREKLYARRIRPESIMTSSGAVKSYNSMLRIYSVLSQQYRERRIYGEAAEMYMVRTAKNVLGKYNLLSDADKKMAEKSFMSFRKDVMSHRGFGDIKLKIKCSGKMGSLFYRAENKLISVLKKR